MRRTLIYLIILMVIAGAVWFLAQPHASAPFVANTSQPPESSAPQPTVSSATPASIAPAIVPPLSNALSRITKKPFGIYVTPQNSPVNPERFTGYHTGVDFETTPAEQNTDVPINVICTGKLLLKEWASGYGGVAVQSCNINGQAVTVIYGHLNIATVAPAVGQDLQAGQHLAMLGKGYSQQTDGERKHLHLGIHKGQSINILGYVQNKLDLVNWIDPETLLK